MFRIVNTKTDINPKADVSQNHADAMKQQGRREALARIDGCVTDDGKSVVYYDDSTHSYYIAPLADIDELVALIDSDDSDVSRDAYSHWCAMTSHDECDANGGAL